MGFRITMVASSACVPVPLCILHSSTFPTASVCPVPFPSFTLTVTDLDLSFIFLLSRHVFCDIFITVHVERHFRVRFQFGYPLFMLIFSTDFRFGLLDDDEFPALRGTLLHFSSICLRFRLAPFIRLPQIETLLAFCSGAFILLLFFTRITFSDLQLLTSHHLCSSFFSDGHDIRSAQVSAMGSFPLLPFFVPLYRYGLCPCYFFAPFVLHCGSPLPYRRHFRGFSFIRLPQRLQKLCIPFRILGHKLKCHI